MEITRNDIVGEGLDQRIWILDFELNDEEASTAERIGVILAAKVATLQPPFGAILAALIVSQVNTIHSKNQGRGVGANIHFKVLPPPTVLIKNLYFSL